MIRCAYCGYHWQDSDEDYPSCHYEGPEGWAPCEYDDEPIEEEDEK